MSQPLEPYLTTEEAARYLKLSVGTLQNYRIDGSGPPYIQRVKRGKVFYDRAQLDAWRSGQVRVSTSAVTP